MVFIRLTAQEKHKWKHSKYGFQANDLAKAELAEAETEKTPLNVHEWNLQNWEHLFLHSEIWFRWRFKVTTSS